MKAISPAFLIATATALVTVGLIALLFLLPITSGNSVSSDIGLRPHASKAGGKQDGFIATNSAMNLSQMGAIITRLDSKAEHPRKGFWRFTIEGASVIVVGDNTHDRLRILVGIQSSKKLTQAQLSEITQANFDSALDARYAISQDILWAIYVHPLTSLANKQFISAIGQTVNLAISYGDGNSSGGILFDDGKTKDTQRYEMIQKLVAKGLGS